MTKSLLISLVASLALPALGNTLIVSSVTDSGPGSLRDQVAAATSGDTITFTVHGTITLTNEITLTDKNLTIAGPGPTNLTVTTGDKSRALSMANAEVTISGLTFSHCSSTSAVIETGGAIAIDNFTSGGGSNLTTITDCAFVNNESGWGGALDVFHGGLMMSGCTFVSNSCVGVAFGTDGGGGALCLGVTLPSTIANCTFSGNRQSGLGTDQAGGGAIYNFGAVPTNPPPVTLEHCTFVANVDVAGPAGAIKGNHTVSYDTMAQLKNCLLVNNQAPAGALLNFAGDTNGVLTGTYISLGGNATDEGTSSTTFMSGANDKVSDAGIAASLSSLAYNGGPTKTHAMAPGSPAQGNALASTITVDQRGAPRHANADAGAYELIEPELHVSVAGTTIENDDGLAFDPTPVGAPVLKTVVISNAQTSTFVAGPLTLGDVSVPTGYSIGGFTPPALGNGESTTFELTLTASSAGLVTGTVSFTNNDGLNPDIYAGDPASETPFVMHLSGLVTDTMDHWRKQYFGPSAENSGDAADDAAPAGDGIANLLKYALGLNPIASYPSGINVATDLTPEGSLRMTVTRNPAATDVMLSIEVSGDLKSASAWSDADTAVDEDALTTYQAHDTTPSASAQSRFIRLSVARP